MTAPEASRTPPAGRTGARGWDSADAPPIHLRSPLGAGLTLCGRDPVAERLVVELVATARADWRGPKCAVCFGQAGLVDPETPRPRTSIVDPVLFDQLRLWGDA